MPGTDYLALFTVREIFIHSLLNQGSKSISPPNGNFLFSYTFYCGAEEKLNRCNWDFVMSREQQAGQANIGSSVELPLDQLIVEVGQVNGTHSIKKAKNAKPQKSRSLVSFFNIFLLLLL